jgi:hypothetical protein
VCPSAAASRLAVIDGDPVLAALSPGRPLRRIMLRIASTLYDGLRLAALFSALRGAPKDRVLVLAPGVDVRARWWLLGALANTGKELDVLEMSLEVAEDGPSGLALWTRLPLGPAFRCVVVFLRVFIGHSNVGFGCA